MSVLTFCTLGVVIGVGAFVQRVVGFGLAVVAAPFVVLLEPHVMPAALLICVLPLPLLEVAHDHRAILWRPLLAALAGRLLTTPAGVWLVAVSSATAVSCVVAVMVLVAVAGSFVRSHVRPTSPLSFGAGLLTGVSATAASIGGPFFALVLQDQRPQRVRSTLGPFFVVGAATSLAALAAGGEVPGVAVLAGVGWLPFVALGVLLAAPARRRLDAARLKRAVLALSAIAAVAVLVRAAL